MKIHQYQIIKTEDEFCESIAETTRPKDDKGREITGNTVLKGKKRQRSPKSLKYLKNDVINYFLKANF